MKEVLISIQPQRVEKILNGEKTIEIRKTKPKCDLPCKVYIYCTKGKSTIAYIERKGEKDWFGNIAKQTLIVTRPKYDYMNYFNETLGKVVAEFTLNKVERFDVPYPAYFYQVQTQIEHIVKGSCLPLTSIHHYLKNDSGYAWFIDDLKIYDKPKELSEFRKDLDCDDYPCNKGGKNSDCEYYYYDITEGCSACRIDFDGEHCIYKTIKRPPRSWCYIKEVL